MSTLELAPQTREPIPIVWQVLFCGIVGGPILSIWAVIWRWSGETSAMDTVWWATTGLGLAAILVLAVGRALAERQEPIILNLFHGRR